MSRLHVSSISNHNRLHLSDKEFGDLPTDLRLDDTGTMTIKFKIVGANKYDDETLAEFEISYDMEYEIEKIEIKKLTLQESTAKAVRDHEVTRTQPIPSP